MLLGTRNLKLQGPRKLENSFIGTFTITEEIGKTVNRLDLIGGHHRQALSGIHDVFHVALLRPYQDNSMQASTPPVMVHESVEYETKRFLQHRALMGKTQYLVRCRGYDLSEDMYLAESEMGNAADLLRDYRAQA